MIPAGERVHFMFQRFHVIRRQIGSVLLGLCFASGPLAAARAGSLFDILGYDGSLTPGAPRSPDFMYRRLVEEGFVLRSDLVQTGPVYIANVEKSGEPLCLVLDVFNGTILQAFMTTPAGLRAVNRDAPGPGYPGYPPFPDARFVKACSPTQTAVVVPSPTPQRRAPRPRVLNRRPRKAHGCRPDSKPAKTIDLPAAHRAGAPTSPPGIRSETHAALCARPTAAAKTGPSG